MTNKVPTTLYFVLVASIFALLFWGKVDLDLSALGSHLTITSH